jgi:hypothetical protein
LNRWRIGAGHAGRLAQAEGQPRTVSRLASPTFKTSNRLVGWIREMELLRRAIGQAA